MTNPRAKPWHSFFTDCWSSSEADARAGAARNHTRPQRSSVREQPEQKRSSAPSSTGWFGGSKKPHIKNADNPEAQRIRAKYGRG